ncbi:hypothetical protein D3C78_998980 [compost metagenome]
MLLQPGNQRLFTDDDAGLWAAQQFVTGEGHQINPGSQQPLRHRFGRQAVLRHINQRAAAQIGGGRQAVFGTQLRQLGFVHRGGKALNAVVAGMHLHQQPGLIVNRVTVVFQMGAVGGADFDQLAARLTHHVGNTERAANFH